MFDARTLDHHALGQRLSLASGRLAPRQEHLAERARDVPEPAEIAEPVVDCLQQFARRGSRKRAQLGLDTVAERGRQRRQFVLEPRLDRQGDARRLARGGVAISSAAANRSTGSSTEIRIRGGSTSR